MPNYRLISLIATTQQYYPNMRVGQLLTNAASFAGWKQEDIFYCPDETLEKGLKIMIENREMK